jgi:hypothetical protein
VDPSWGFSFSGPDDWTGPCHEAVPGLGSGLSRGFRTRHEGVLHASCPALGLVGLFRIVPAVWRLPSYRRRSSTGRAPASLGLGTGEHRAARLPLRAWPGPRAFTRTFGRDKPCSRSSPR